MHWKEEVLKQLDEIKELTDYISEDTEANNRLTKIRHFVELAEEAIKQIEDVQ